MVNIKILDLNKININEKPYKIILICCIGYVTVKRLSYAKINSVNPLYLIIDKINGHIDEIIVNKYLKLVLIDESK